MPVDYWHDRYLEALAKAEQSLNPTLREIYLELADHYRTMHSLVGDADNDGSGEGDQPPHPKVS